MIRCFNSLHSLCHVLGSMCSSIHVSYLMVGCLVLTSYLCASYMLFTLWFISWHLFFIFHSPVPWISIYRVHSSIVVQSNVHRYKEFKNLVCTIWGGVYPICCNHETNMPSSPFCSLMECIWMSPRRYAYELISTSNSCLISYIC